MGAKVDYPQCNIILKNSLNLRQTQNWCSRRIHKACWWQQIRQVWWQHMMHPYPYQLRCQCGRILDVMPQCLSSLSALPGKLEWMPSRHCSNAKRIHRSGRRPCYMQMQSTDEHPSIESWDSEKQKENGMLMRQVTAHIKKYKGQRCWSKSCHYSPSCCQPWSHCHVTC